MVILISDVDNLIKTLNKKLNKLLTSKKLGSIINLVVENDKRNDL